MWRPPVATPSSRVLCRCADLGHSLVTPTLYLKEPGALALTMAGHLGAPHKGPLSHFLLIQPSHPRLRLTFLIFLPQKGRQGLVCLGRGGVWGGFLVLAECFSFQCQQ